MRLAKYQPTKNAGASVRRRSSLLGIVATQLGILIAILGLWQFAVTDSSLPYFSRPSIVAAKLYELLSQSNIYRHIYVTLSEIAIGYALGAGFGLTLGFILGPSQFLSSALQPYIIGLYSIPTISLPPLFTPSPVLALSSTLSVI